MTTTARQMTTQTVAGTEALAALIINGIFEDLEQCETCPALTDYLYARLDEDGDEVHVCETCAADLGYVAD